MPLEKVVTHHPLRTIVLEYDRGITPPDFEKSALDSYFHMHDEVWRLKTMREDYEPRLERAIAQIAELRTDLYPIEQEIDVLELVTGLREDNPMPGFDGSISLKLDSFREATRKHNDALMALYEGINRVTEEHNAFLKEFDAFEAWFEAFADGPLHELYQRWEELSVDTVSLDNDHQNFLGDWAPTIEAERDYFERASDAFEAYAELVDAANALYRRAETVDAALDEFVKNNKNGGKSGWKRFKD